MGDEPPHLTKCTFDELFQCISQRYKNLEAINRALTTENLRLADRVAFLEGKPSFVQRVPETPRLEDVDKTADLSMSQDPLRVLFGETEGDDRGRREAKLEAGAPHIKLPTVSVVKSSMDEREIAPARTPSNNSAASEFQCGQPLPSPEAMGDFPDHYSDPSDEEGSGGKTRSRQGSGVARASSNGTNGNARTSSGKELRASTSSSSSSSSTSTSSSSSSTSTTTTSSSTTGRASTLASVASLPPIKPKKHSRQHTANIDSFCEAGGFDEDVDTTRSESQVVGALKDSMERATQQKNKGNNYFTEHKYLKANECYSLAIEILEDYLEKPIASTPPEVLFELATYYSNRSTCSGKIGEWKKAYADADKIVEYRPEWWKGYSARASLFANQKKWKESLEQYELALSKELSPAEREKLEPRRKMVLRKVRSEAGGAFVAPPARPRRSNRLQDSQGGSLPEASSSRKRTRSRSDEQRPDVEQVFEDVDNSRVGLGDDLEPNVKEARGVRTSERLMQKRGPIEGVVEESQHVDEVNPNQLQVPKDDRFAMYDAPNFKIDSISTAAPTLLLGEPSLGEKPFNSPMKAPGRSPAKVLPPSPAKPRDEISALSRYADFPRLTSRGIQDLLGDDRFTRSLDLLQLVALIKTEPPRPPTRGARLLGRCFLKKRVGPRDRRARTKNEEICQAHAQFTGNRVTSYQCTCPDFAEGLRRADGDPSYYVRPCEHIGAVLLVLKKKMEEDEQDYKLLVGEGHQREYPEGVMYLTPERALTADQELEQKEWFGNLQKYSLKQLQDQLGLNGQKRTGSKDELVSRTLDGIMRGALPHCPLCHVGHLWYAAGKYRCSGSFDATTQQRINCTFTAACTDIRRSKWKFEEPHENVQ